MYIKEGKGKLALFYTASNVLLTPLLFIFYFPPPPQFYYFPSSIFLFPPPPPPPPHFYCFPYNDVSDVNLFPPTFMRFPPKKRSNRCALYYLLLSNELIKIKIRLLLLLLLEETQK